MIKYKNQIIYKNKNGEIFIRKKQKFFTGKFITWYEKVSSFEHAKLKIEYENMLRK